MRTIIVKTSYEGIHRYENAPDEVSFLRQPHRHMFGVIVEIEVFHDDRELEFILVKRFVNTWLSKHYTDNVWDMGSMSCEQVAEDLIRAVQDQYCLHYLRYIKVTVTEDDENGASVTAGS